MDELIPSSLCCRFFVMLCYFNESTIHAMCHFYTRKYFVIPSYNEIIAFVLHYDNESNNETNNEPNGVKVPLFINGLSSYCSVCILCTLIFNGAFCFISSTLIITLSRLILSPSFGISCSLSCRKPLSVE